ncbi:hypothetical protein ABT065_23960 [Streptomyces sp. NPDC002764]|uniref:hypothetical protein n=1 Tax=Streptomyces sp. NPDC002764 TaxID=3154428 RepID=UPI003323A692
MTHDPHEESTAGGGPSERQGETAPQWEVMTGPGGAEAAPEPAWDRVWRRRSGRARAVIAATTVAVLALGGTVAYAATSGGPGSGATPSASGSASPSPGGPGYGHGGRWFDFGGMGVHGESTVKDQDTGKWVVRVWQRGTVEKVDGDQVTVKSEDGARWTWTVDSGTTVLHDGTKGTGTGSLKKDDTVFLVGTRSDSGTRTALRVLSGPFDGKGPGDEGSDHGRRGGFPGHGPHRWGMPSPSASPSGSGATT